MTTSNAHIKHYYSTHGCSKAPCSLTSNPCACFALACKGSRFSLYFLSRLISLSQRAHGFFFFFFLLLLSASPLPPPSALPPGPVWSCMVVPSFPTPHVLSDDPTSTEDEPFFVITCCWVQAKNLNICRYLQRSRFNRHFPTFLET